MTGAPRRFRLDAEYVLPLRWSSDEGLPELASYLRRIAAVMDVTVVDGSDPALFENHRAQLPACVRHLRPEPWPGRNGKVAGVVTGVRHARWEWVVLADDDVRYTEEQLQHLLSRLHGADVVRPQNYFTPLPWHARWDSARSLLNRAVAADYPGTFGLRRSVFLGMGGYDGDALFENLQMLRTLIATGARQDNAVDLYVGRRPPTLRQFLDQRVRQAYDDFAQPGRLALELSWLPLLALTARRPRRLVGAGVAVALIAEIGRRRGGGSLFYPRTAALWAPAWVVERAVCVWLAVVERVRGGVRYRGARLRHAATPVTRRPPLTGAPATVGPVRSDLGDVSGAELETAS